jgi:hypothetical protein
MCTQGLTATESILALSHPQSGPPQQNQVAVPQPPFRYVILKKTLLHNGRVLIVLMEAEHFSEDNLRELFKLLSKRFPTPGELHVGVFTNLSQLPTPEEEDHQELSPTAEESSVKQVARYANASYTRAKGSEVFHYSMGGGQTEQQVIIKGEPKPGAPPE